MSEVEGTVGILNAITNSDLSLITFMLLVCVAEAFVIRRLWNERQEHYTKYQKLVEAGHEVVKTVNEHLADGNMAHKRIVKAIALLAQDRLEGTGIDLGSLLDL